MKKLILIILSIVSVNLVFPQANVTTRQLRVDSVKSLAGGDIYYFADMLPAVVDSFDLGSSTLLWRKGWLSEMQAILFAKNTISLLGGWFYVTKNQGTIKNMVDESSPVIDFGQAMTLNDIVIFRNAGVVEYVKVGSVLVGTAYMVTRNLDGSGANSWTQGTPYAVLGQAGAGRIELKAGSSAGDTRMSIIQQGSSYNAQTEVLRIGDLDGYLGYTSTTYGFGMGSNSGTKANITIDTINGIRIRNGNTDKFVVDNDGNVSLTGNVTLSNQASITLSGFNNDAGFITSASAGNKTYYQTTAPSSGITTGDFWFDTDDYATFRYNGTNWNNRVSVYMDAYGLYAGNINASQVTAGIFTGLTFQTDAGTAGHYKRSVISASDNELHFYDSSNSEVVRIGEDVYLSSVPGVLISGGVLAFGNGGAIGASGNDIYIDPPATGKVLLSAAVAEISGNTVWHAGNMGTGSLLDADMVDGKHASDFSLSGHNHSGVYAPASQGAVFASSLANFYVSATSGGANTVIVNLDEITINGVTKYVIQ
jgi:hypothetical protein